MFKFYAPDFLLNFVRGSCDENAIKLVTGYIKFSYKSLLTDLNLLCEEKRVEDIQLLHNNKILQIKSEVKPLSSEKEGYIRDSMCKCLKLPPDSVSFLGPVYGCITLVYRYNKTLDDNKQQLLQNTILVKDLAPLAHLDVTWLRIDNMELKIPSVEESSQVITCFSAYVRIAM